MPILAEALDTSNGMMLDVDPPTGSRPLSFRPEYSAIRLQRAAVAAKEMDAKRAAEAAAYAEQNRVDPLAAYSAITNAPQTYGHQRILDDPKWQELAKKTPKLAEFLSDPVNLKIAENDIENLSGLEYAWARVKQTGEAMTEGVGQQLAQRRQSNALFKFMMHTAEPDLFQVSKDDLRDLEEYNLDSGLYDERAAIFKRQPTARAAMATTNAMTQILGTLGYGVAGSAIGAGLGALAGGRGGAPGVVAGAGTGATIGRNVAVFYDSFKMNAANDFREFASLKDEAGQPINQRVAAYAAITSGLVNAAMDAYVVDKVTGAIAPGVADKLRKLGGGRVVGDLLKRPGFRDELLKYGKDVAKLSALEVGTEGVQRAISLVVRELAKADAEHNMGSAPFASPTMTEPLRNDQGQVVEPSYLSQVGNEMQEALWGMPGSIAILRTPRSVMAIRHQQNITASQDELKALDEANSATEQSATRQASPEAFNRLMHILGGKNASDAVHIDADAVTRLFQNEGIDPAQGVRETFGESMVQPYEEALALGQSFRVPTQQFATEIAGTEMYSKLRESGGIRIRPEGLTEADIKLIDANNEADMARLDQLAADITSGKVTETPVREVYRDIQAQLTGLNRYDRATIDAYASQQAAFFGTLAGRMNREGVTAKTLYEPYRLRIVNEMPRIIQRVERARFDEQLDPLLEGVRAGKVPTEKDVRGPSLLDFVLEKGGLVDSGGELAAMDANAGRVGKNTIVRKNGRTLDAMAEVAHEAGYLKGRDIQELLDGIAGELKGQPVFAPGNENAGLMTKRQQMLDLQEALGGLGLDIGQYSNAELRDALFKAGQESRGEAGRLNQFAGQNAETADLTALDKAKQRIAAGEDAEAVRKDTGWHTGVDGKWRFEISDADARLVPAIKSLDRGGYDAADIQEVTYRKNDDGTYSVALMHAGAKDSSGFVNLDSVPEEVVRAILPDDVFAAVQRGDGEADFIGANLDDAKAIKMPFRFDGMNALPLDMVIDHPALFAAYPALRQVMVRVDPKVGIGGSLAEMDDGAFVITVGSGQKQSTILHEIQHAIQSYEGFAAGGSSRDAFADPRMRPGATKAGRDAAFTLLAEKLAELKQPDSIEQFARNAWGTDEITKELEASYADYVKTVSEAAVAPNIQRAAQEWAAKEWYRRLAGEVEARNTQARASMSDAERRATSPQSTADVAERDQIVTFAKGLAEMVSDKPTDTDLAEAKRQINEQLAIADRMIAERGGLFAPNGEKSNLNRMQWAQVRTANFKRWFGDWEGDPDGASKVVDANGEPLVVYHGTGGDFDAFDRNKGGEASGNSAGKKGYFFSGSTAIASDYALRAKGDPNVMPAFLALPKPTNRKFRDIDQLDYWASVNDFSGGLMAETGDGQRVFMVKDANQIKSATGNAGTFSGKTNNILHQQARGHLAWNAAREFTLTLTGKADFSTFLHESAHFYLEVYRDLVKQGGLPEQMQQDWEQITRYLSGYADKAIPEIRATLESLRQQKDRATEPADLRRLTSAIATHEKALELAEANGGEAFMQQVALTFGDNVADDAVRAVLVTPFHEAWARSMEGYFMDGKAPSLELMGAFSRFRVWMKQIYQTLTGLNVKLTDEVRGVMDRMFAMDDEIAEAREMQNAKPLFASLAAAGMTKAQYDAYLKVVALADDQIEAEALAMMGSAEKQRLRQVAAKRDEVRNEVENELNRQKTQMLIHFLRTGNFRDGHDMGVYVHPMKLDRQTIIDRKGPEFLKALPKGMYRDASQATESERQWIVDPDGMAMLFGYSSGDEMLMDLANERITSESKRREAIEAETEARLRQYFPDVTTSGESADIAMKAVHHATRADVLAREAELLADRIGEKATPDKIIQAYAVQKIAETPVFELQTGVYLRAASKAANAAFAALNKGDYKTALLEKQRERVNFHLYNEAMRAQEATAKIGDYLGSFDKKSKRQTIGKAGGTEYALISGGDVSFHPTQKDAETARVKSGNPRAFIEQRNRFLDQIDNLRDRHEIGEHYTKGDLRAMESMESFTRQMAEEGGEAPLVESWMFNNVPWQRLSFAQYIALASAIRSIEMLARNRYNLSRMQKGMDLEQVTTEIADAVRATGDSHKQAESFNRSPTDVAGEVLADVVAVHAKAEFIMELLDGGPNGPMYRHFMKPAQEAEVLENDRIAEMRQAVAKIFSVYTLAESARLGTGLSRLQVSVPELNTSMNREGLLALALNWGNEYNRMAVIEGQADRNSAWTAENVEKALNAHLTDKDWDVVEQVWELVNSYWPEVKALEERVSGVAPEKVEASPFRLASGRVMAGGYYPLTYAPWNAKQAMQDAKTMLSGGIVESGLGSRAMTKHGHTQERTNSGGKPVMLTLDGLDRHLTSVIHDLTYRELLTDWNRILNNKSVRDAIVGAQGVAMYKQLQLWMRRIANDRQPMDTFVHQVFNRLNAGVSVMLLGLSLGNAMMQQSGYLLAVPTLGGRSVAQGMIRFWTNPMGTLKFIRERSGFMRQRDITFSREVRDAMKDLNPGDRAVNAVRRVAFWLTAKSQMAVDAATWMAAYEKALRGDAGPNMAKGSESDAVDYADSAVRKTQSGGSAKDLATIQGQNPVFKALTPLYGYFSVLFNQFLLAKRQAGRHFRQGEYLRAGDRIISNVIFLWLAPFLLSELLAMRGPDDGEEWGDWLKKKGGDMIAYPFMSVIGLNWFANYYAHPERGLGNMPSFGAMKTMAQALESVLDIGLQPFTEDDITDHQDVENIAMGLGFATATPVKGIYNLTETFVMWAADEYEPQSMQELMRSAMRGVPKEAYTGE